jgi:hypothetical protein
MGGSLGRKPGWLLSYSAKRTRTLLGCPPTLNPHPLDGSGSRLDFVDTFRDILAPDLVLYRVVPRTYTVMMATRTVIALSVVVTLLSRSTDAVVPCKMDGSSLDCRCASLGLVQVCWTSDCLYPPTCLARPTSSSVTVTVSLRHHYHHTHVVG